MEKDDLLEDMFNYLNEIGQYNYFVIWMTERGYSQKEVEDAVDKYLEWDL
jgi:hypothetical protein